ncbi:unnamed protein product, partial [Brassica oleracea]
DCDLFSTYDLRLQLQKQYELISNVLSENMGRDDVFKCRRIKKEKLQMIRKKVITSRRAVDTTEAMSGVVVNACYFQDHTAPSYLNELIRHGKLLME